MTISDTLLLLNVLMLVPLGIMTVLLAHMLKSMNHLERRISRIEGQLR